MTKSLLIRHKNGGLSIVLRAKGANIAHNIGLEYVLLILSHQFILV